MIKTGEIIWGSRWEYPSPHSAAELNSIILNVSIRGSTLGVYFCY
uniref:Uncharacterized protein n=1 Tax=Arundo donax TaxID=35708 RepID=A0A0A9EES7_ARUDO